MATVETTTHDLPGPAGPIRIRRLAPRGLSNVPVIVAWSDIFQQTPSHQRTIERIASHGFVVLSPEHYCRVLPPGTVLDFERDRELALKTAGRLELPWIDQDRAAILDYAEQQAAGAPIGTIGWCFGGHLAFRAALSSKVRAAVCCYATGLHNDSLGAAQGTASTLARAGELSGALLLIWGSNDPHIPAEGRAKISAALTAAGITPGVLVLEGEHAFMRDEGPRYDPAATDAAFTAILDFFRRRL